MPADFWVVLAILGFALAGSLVVAYLRERRDRREGRTRRRVYRLVAIEYPEKRWGGREDAARRVPRLIEGYRKPGE